MANEPRSLPDEIARIRAQQPPGPAGLPQPAPVAVPAEAEIKDSTHPSPLLSLAAGWDSHSADLRTRAGNLMARAAEMRGGTPDAVDRLATQDPLTLEHAARRNIISATVLENCANDLRRHIRVVSRDGLDRLLAAVEQISGDAEAAQVDPTAHIDQLITEN